MLFFTQKKLFSILPLKKNFPIQSWKAICFANIVQNDLRQAGWKWNSKSDWNVRQTGEYLGLFIDTVRFVFTVPPAKVYKLKQLIANIINNSNKVLVRNICRLTGFLNALHLAIGDEVRIFTRFLNLEVENSRDYNYFTKISKGSI